MRKKVMKLNKKQSKKWAADQDEWLSSAVSVNRGGREWHEEVNNFIDFNLNLFDDHEEYFEATDSGIVPDPAVHNVSVRRPTVQEWQWLAENWHYMEWRLLDVISGCGLPLYTCSSTEIVNVRHIDLGRTYIDLDSLAVT
jgi:hypothetical protein